MGYMVNINGRNYEPSILRDWDSSLDECYMIVARRLINVDSGNVSYMDILSALNIAMSEITETYKGYFVYIDANGFSAKASIEMPEDDYPMIAYKFSFNYDGRIQLVEYILVEQDCKSEISEFIGNYLMVNCKVD